MHVSVSLALDSSLSYRLVIWLFAGLPAIPRSSRRSLLLLTLSMANDKGANQYICQGSNITLVIMNRHTCR